MVSVVLSAYKRPELLRIGLSSILRYKPNFDFEIIVVNDGIIDNTEAVCQEFKDQLDIKYIFSGKRNLDGKMKSRVSGFALNIGIKQAQGDIVVLSCPEIYHLNNALQIVVEELKANPNTMAIPATMHFDIIKYTTEYLLGLSKKELETASVNTELLAGGTKQDGWSGHCVMPYLMAVYKSHIIDMGGFDEDFTGYAGEDNDFCERLQLKGLRYKRTNAQIVHLWHGNTGNGSCHWDNPAWVHNWNLLQSRKGILKRNEGREWGVIE